MKAETAVDSGSGTAGDKITLMWLTISSLESVIEDTFFNTNKNKTFKLFMKIKKYLQPCGREKRISFMKSYLTQAIHC